MPIIFQPKAGLPKHGTIVVGVPAGSQAAPAGSGWAGANYTINTYVTNLPTTGEVEATYSGRFDDPRYYNGDTAS